ncbi:MAG: hypothetical protein AB7P37_10575 [Ramlibacter sp.]
MTALPYADEGLKKYIRYSVLGHKSGDDVNVKHLHTAKQEMAALVAAVEFGLPVIAKFDIEHGLNRVKVILAKTLGTRSG